MSAVLAAPDSAGFSGASVFFTSADPAIRQARSLVADGRLREAQALLDQPGPDPAAAAEGREIIRRLRHDYDLTRDGLVRKLRSSIPEVTPADVDRWREAGQAQARTLDGEVLFFRREPSNIFRFCPEAIERRRTAGRVPADTGGPAKLVEYLGKVVAAARDARSPLVMPVRHRVTYRLTVSPDRPGAGPGSLVRCWLPFPQEYRQQTGVRLIRTSPAEYRLSPNGSEGSRILPEAHRTVYLEQKIENPARPVVFEEEFEFVCHAYYPHLEDQQAQPLRSGDFAPYLQERSPHILFSPRLRDTVRQVVGEETNPLRKVRRIYHHLNSAIRYCAEEEYAIIPGFSEKALLSGRGDCGIQSMIFITMCRAAGVPARWQSGWETKPWGFNMHDWAEFYVEPWGWLPADMSYGLQPSDDPAVREFYIGHLDAYRLIVNLDYGCPLVPAKSSLRSEPADFQRGEVEIDGRNLYFDEWDYDMRFEWEPVTAP